MTVRRTRRWHAANGLMYEEEEEVVHMNAGSGGNSSHISSTGLVRRSKNGTSLLISSPGTSDMTSAAKKFSDTSSDSEQLPDAATGGNMFWDRGSGGFSWSWRR